MRSIQPKTFALYLIPLLLLFALSWDGLLWLYPKWTDLKHGAYNHGFLLLGVSLWLLFRRVDFVADATEQGRKVGLLLTVFLIIGVFLTGAVSISSLQITLLYLSLYSYILAFFGFKVFKKSILPLGLVIFALPIWGGVTDVLQLITHEMAYLLVKLIGIPVFKDGFNLNVPAGSFEVEPSCSGVSYLLAAAPLAIVYAISNFSKRKTILTTVAAIVFASIIANWLRVFIIVVVGEMTNMQHSLVKDHYNLGWLLFGAFFIILVFLFNWIYRDESNGNEGVVGESGQQVTEASYRVAYSGVIIVTLSSLMLMGFQWYLNLQDRPLKELSAYTSIPAHFRISYNSQWTPIINGADIDRYQDPQSGVYFYRAIVPHQKEGQEVVSTLNVLFDKSHWLIKSKRVLSFDGASINQYELESKKAARPLLVWTWYRVDNKNFASQIKVKLYGILSYLKGDNSGAFLGLYVEDEEGAKDRLQSTYKQIVDSQ